MALNSAQLIATGQLDGFRNRIINGDMRIDQRNSGAATTISNDLIYSIDRWYGQDASAGIFTLQQSADAPTGFTTSLLATVTAAGATTITTEYMTISQVIEGTNLADFNLGTANAVQFTLGFWVKCSATGTFGGSFRNNTATRSYPFQYTISAANTWEKKIITITGDTSGTWSTSTTGGMNVMFTLGSGTFYSGPAGSWQNGNFHTVNGSTSIIETLNATWRIAGVQLEKGPVATDFDLRSYGQELALCQRYYQAAPMRYTNCVQQQVANNGQKYYHFSQPFPVSMRVAPAVAIPSGVITGIDYPNYSAGYVLSSTASRINIQHNVGATGGVWEIDYTANAEF